MPRQMICPMAALKMCAAGVCHHGPLHVKSDHCKCAQGDEEEPCDGGFKLKDVTCQPIGQVLDTEP